MSASSRPAGTSAGGSGVVGEHPNPFSDDKANGVDVGNRVRMFGIGPSLVYDAPS